MSKRVVVYLFLCLVVLMGFGCASGSSVDKKVGPELMVLHDQERNRDVPIAIYQTKKTAIQHKIPVVISHGYGKNQGGDYLNYSYLASVLAEEGYFVVSIQHELPTDELMPNHGKPQEVRLPFWERGTQNILFVVAEIKSRFPGLDFKKLVLIGHSNGGDTSMLLGGKFPQIADKIITLDNRRMAFPRTAKPRIYSIRSSDFPADEGVLPDESERRQFAITIDFSSVPHDNMSDSGSEAEKNYLADKVSDYIED